jgi:hypothetical protein
MPVLDRSRGEVSHRHCGSDALPRRQSSRSKGIPAWQGRPPTASTALADATAGRFIKNLHDLAVGDLAARMVGTAVQQ